MAGLERPDASRPAQVVARPSSTRLSFYCGHRRKARSSARTGSLDGSGYPQGLKDGAILPEARILAVADTVEAMASHRPYRPSLGIERALGTIESERGIAYDAAVVDACVKLFREGRFSFDEERTGRAQDERGPEPKLG